MPHPDKDRWTCHHGWILMGCLEPLTISWQIIRIIIIIIIIIIIMILAAKKKGIKNKI